MAQLATKPQLVASLNMMLTAQKQQGDARFTEEEIIEILSAMAETHAMSSNPPQTQPMHWHTTPARVV